jgi:fatty acid desaturase
MKPQPSHAYARSLKAWLPANVHQPAISRLWWLPAHVLLIGLGIVALASGWLPLWLAWVASLVVGLGFAGLTFLAHETLHGAVVRGRFWQRLVGRVGFLPFAISPRLWLAWHNRVHHGSTQQPGKDPDAFPTLEAYRGSRATRFMMDWVGATRRAPFGLLALLLGFTIQSTEVLVGARRYRMLPKGQHRIALLETALAWSLWLGMGLLLGPIVFVFGFVLPLVLANTIVMAHILTNHALSPLTEVNDPLLNSLSVTVPRWVQWLTLGFGFHTEHHLYPWLSTRHAPAVKSLIMERWPERYQSMSLLRALWTVYRTPRIYADATTLVEPHSGRRWPTLQPQEPPREPALARSEGAGAAHQDKRGGIERTAPAPASPSWGGALTKSAQPNPVLP